MSRKILVRNYRSDDLTHVKEILSEYPSPTGRVWSEDMVKEMLSDALREQPDGVFVAEMGGKVVGLAVVIHRDWFNISLPLCSQGMLEWINRGVGHKLIERCISWAREKGLRIIYTETGKKQRRSHQILSEAWLRHHRLHPRLLQKGIRRCDPCEETKLTRRLVSFSKYMEKQHS